MKNKKQKTTKKTTYKTNLSRLNVMTWMLKHGLDGFKHWFIHTSHVHTQKDTQTRAPCHTDHRNMSAQAYF